MGKIIYGFKIKRNSRMGKNILQNLKGKKTSFHNERKCGEVIYNFEEN